MGEAEAGGRRKKEEARRRRWRGWVVVLLCIISENGHFFFSPFVNLFSHRLLFCFPLRFGNFGFLHILAVFGSNFLWFWILQWKKTYFILYFTFYSFGPKLLFVSRLIVSPLSKEKWAFSKTWISLIILIGVHSPFEKKKKNGQFFLRFFIFKNGF